MPFEDPWRMLKNVWQYYVYVVVTRWSSKYFFWQHQRTARNVGLARIAIYNNVAWLPKLSPAARPIASAKGDFNIELFSLSQEWNTTPYPTLSHPQSDRTSVRLIISLKVMMMLRTWWLHCKSQLNELLLKVTLWSTWWLQLSWLWLSVFVGACWSLPMMLSPR